MAPMSAAVSSSTNLNVRTLTDGGQQPLEVAQLLADWLGAARRSLDLAQYDFHLAPETVALVGGAIKDAEERGVAVRILYDVEHANPIPVPPPPEPDVELIASLGVPAKAIAGIPDLMHHKFVVRDEEAVWTGSANWTDDSWSRQENVIVTVESPELAGLFTSDFRQLWETGSVEGSGKVPPKRVRVDDTLVRPWFTPGFGEDTSQRIARTIARAKRRVRICSPVISAAPVLATLAQVVSEGEIDVAGCVDATQVLQVEGQWEANGNVAWKLPLLERVMAGEFTGKRSTPYGPGTVHDYMHAKAVVADDIVFTGSFNLSRSGEKNAENVLEIHDAELAERLAGYIDEVRRLYPRVQLAAAR
ncbi:MAG: phosphatidylserine/phosphatidylglycerophosphate/cardiolipin synthase family protein [Actinomycetota bacterium]|nr:phosphatidylserine/phosphatidylglycerophosphate/cardiolipin synthase family protein [Actinomycetota bacterium]